MDQASSSSASNTSQQPSPRFDAHSPFLRDLRARTDDYFKGPGAPLRDPPLMYVKTFVILAWFALSWALLVFAASNAWQAILLSISLGLAGGAIGMNIQHDGNHGAFAKNRWISRAAGRMLDFMGVCSFIWRQRHNAVHHPFTNVQGVDEDLDFGAIARLAPTQPRRPWHAYQHVYLWVLYGFLLPKWAFYDDFVIYRTRKIGHHNALAFSPKETVAFVGWKLFYVGWSLVIPAFFHPIHIVLACHLIGVMTLGVTLASVFQLAHVVEEANFPKQGDIAITTDWGAHQLNTTVDFARNNIPLTLFLGGLNYQVEHHLFPKICHIHYPALSLIVEEVAKKHGIQYRHNKTFREAIASHFRLLRKLGQPEYAPAS